MQCIPVDHNSLKRVINFCKEFRQQVKRFVCEDIAKYIADLVYKISYENECTRVASPDIPDISVEIQSEIIIGLVQISQ